jgi:hypothetical protein
MSDTTLDMLNEANAGIVNKKADTCTLGLPNYETLRQQNLTSINTYYNDLLTKYTSSYADYVKNSSGNVSDRAYAETQLKPSTVDLNNQMIALNQQMIDSINEDDNNIIQLKNDLEMKKNKIEELNKKNRNLKSNSKNIETNYKSQNDNLKSANEGLDDIKFWNWVYIAVNIILICAVIGMIVYMIFFSSTSNANNTTKTNTQQTTTNNTTKTNNSKTNTTKSKVPNSGTSTVVLPV